MAGFAPLAIDRRVKPGDDSFDVARIEANPAMTVFAGRK
jgi:hypothetical protein